jgi:ABC-type dipeptide/oligopeptide/nickel transport system permease component
MSSQIPVPKNRHGHIPTTTRIAMIVVALCVLPVLSIYLLILQYAIRITRHMLLKIWDEEHVDKFMERII